MYNKIHSAFCGLVTASGRIKSAAMVLPTAALYIVLHTRPSPCLMVSQLRVTFGYHALCCSLSKFGKNSSDQQSCPTSLFIDVRHCWQGFTRCYLVEEVGFEPTPMPSCASMYLCYLLHHSPGCARGTILLCCPQAFASYQSFAHC